MLKIRTEAFRWHRAGGLTLRAPWVEWYLVSVIGGGPGAFHTVGGHHCPQIVTFHQKLVLFLSTLLVDVDDSSGHLWDALHYHLYSETQKDLQPAAPWSHQPKSIGNHSSCWNWVYHALGW